jgi:hypothetical protein
VPESRIDKVPQDILLTQTRELKIKEEVFEAQDIQRINFQVEITAPGQEVVQTFLVPADTFFDIVRYGATTLPLPRMPNWGIRIEIPDEKGAEFEIGAREVLPPVFTPGIVLVNGATTAGGVLNEIAVRRVRPTHLIRITFKDIANTPPADLPYSIFFTLWGRIIKQLRADVITR